MNRWISTAAISSASFILGSYLSSNDYFAQNPFMRKCYAEANQLQPVALTAPNMQTKIDVIPDPSNASQIMRFGYPGFADLRCFNDFVVSYDRRMRTAYWVQEHLTPESTAFDPSVDRSKSIFRVDESIHPYFRSENSDYLGSGYDRGHLAPAANHRRRQENMDQTFFLSNMSPQVGKGFNRDKWNDLEKSVRKLARKNPNVYVVTGPLYLPHKEADGFNYVKYKVIGKNNVAVPTHFFKVALVETRPNTFELEAYVLPNEAISDEKPLTDFYVPLDAIERAAGFLLFEEVPKKQIVKINGKKTTGFWF